MNVSAIRDILAMDTVVLVSVLYRRKTYNVVFPIDVDECLNVPCSGENSECVNTEGNYSCQCEPGFTGDGYNCTGLFYTWNKSVVFNISFMKADIDECLDDVCEMNAECVNTNGSFSCQCKPGFTGDGYNCTGL